MFQFRGLLLVLWNLIPVSSFLFGARHHGVAGRTTSIKYVPSVAAASDASPDGESKRIRVALTREDGKNGKLRSELERRCGDAIELVELPCIAHQDGEDLPKLATTLAVNSFDYVAVTSPEAAKVLASVWDSVAGQDDAPDVVAVGKATEAALGSFGIPVAFVPSKATASALAAELPPKENEDLTALLYPASAKAAPTLQNGLDERDFVVVRLNTYDTVDATWTEEEKELARSIDVACFGSPSAINGWLANMDGGDNSVLAACIGETSAKACREHSWEESRIFYPESPGIAGWVDAVDEAVSTIITCQGAEDATVRR